VSTQQSRLTPMVVGIHMADQAPEMLGNSSAVERPRYQEEQARRRGHISVRVSFEAHRLAPTYVATAYEHLVPRRRRDLRAAPGAGPAPADQRPSERVGA
jgi:hypothetical protein